MPSTHFRVGAERGPAGSDPKWRESSQSSDEAQCLMRPRRSGPPGIDPRPDVERYGAYPECDADTRLQAGSVPFLVSVDPLLEPLELLETSPSRWGRYKPLPRLLAPRPTTFRADSPGLRPWFGAPGSGKPSRAKRHCTKSRVSSRRSHQVRLATRIPRPAVTLPYPIDTGQCTSTTEV